MKKLLLICSALFVLLLSGCVAHPHHYGYEQGPPPHAPAHGYRAKHRHHDLVYDSHLGVYVVLGYDDHYYLDDHYYRFHDGFWLHSRHLDDDWRRIDYDHVPRKLRKSKEKGQGYDDHPGKGKDKDRSRGRY